MFRIVGCGEAFERVRPPILVDEVAWREPRSVTDQGELLLGLFACTHGVSSDRSWSAVTIMSVAMKRYRIRVGDEFWQSGMGCAVGAGEAGLDLGVRCARYCAKVVPVV